MASIEYDLLAAGTTYPDFRYGLFTDVFGKNFKPYVDDDGMPRIGPAIDLRAFIQATAAVIIGSDPDRLLLARLVSAVNETYVDGDSSLLQSRLDGVFRNWGIQNSLPDFPTVFAFVADFQPKHVLDLALSDIEGSLGSWGDIGIPMSEERAVVASLYFGGYDVSKIANAMVFEGDRVAPWFEMRYIASSTGGGTITSAEAAIRYYQSAQFELYNTPGTADYDDAVDVGQTYTNLRADILPYEIKFDPATIGLNSTGARDAIADFLQPAIIAVAEHYFAEVDHADELLFASSDFTEFHGDDPADGFNGKANDDDFIISTSSLPLTIFGDEGNDVIVALGGNYRLEGGAGNDNLYGGVGNDTLVGGVGIDKLWGGGGTDRLEGGKGNDTYILGGDEELDPDSGGNPNQIGASNSDTIVETKKGGTDTVIAQVNSGDFNLRFVEKFRLSADMTGSISVNLNEFDSFVLSSGSDDLTLVINRLQKTPIDIRTSGGADVVHIEFEPGVDPSQVLNGKGLTARFRFTDLTSDDTIDLTSIGISDIVMKRDQITDDTGFYLMAPHSKLDLMDGNRIEKTYNNYTDNWFVVKCGDDTPFGPEFIGNVQASHFEI